MKKLEIKVVSDKVGNISTKCVVSALLQNFPQLRTSKEVNNTSLSDIYNVETDTYCSRGIVLDVDNTLTEFKLQFTF